MTLTQQRVTYFEAVRVISTRASQIERGAVYMYSIQSEIHPKDTAECIAIIEFLCKVIPIIIQRKLPGGKTDQLYIRDMFIPDHIVTEFTGRLQQIRADNLRYL